MWRKNRQTTSGSSCLGHDINRNWPYKWDVSGGASDNPCAEDFRGRSAGDAPETKALTSFLQKTKTAQGLKLYIDYHSYSQLFMSRKQLLSAFRFFLLGENMLNPHLQPTDTRAALCPPTTPSCNPFSRVL